MTLTTTRRMFQTLALAGLAATASVPARAAVIEISPTANRSPEYAVSDGGTGRLVGTVTASIGGIGGLEGGVASAPAIALPSLRFDTDNEPGDRVYALDPVSLTAQAGQPLRFTVAVDLSVDLDGVTSFGVVPDVVFARGANPYSTHTGPITFAGTLSTGADATPATEASAGGGASSAQAVPEPASLAVLSLGLVGLAAARRQRPAAFTSAVSGVALAMPLVLAAPSARAAVIQSAPVETEFASDLRFVPSSRRDLVFDQGLGTLNGVTLAFDGTVGVYLAAPLSNEPPLPATVDAAVTIHYARGRIATALDPLVLTPTYTERPGGGGFPYSVQVSGAEARSFDLTFSAGDYGGGAIYTDFRFPALRYGIPSTATDAFFRGNVTALFDYTPVDDGAVIADAGATNVPEPASLAVLGLGLAGLLAARRRVA